MPYSDPHIRFMDTKHSPPTPRWVRERRRFERDQLNLVDAHIHMLTDQVMRSRLDILDHLGYLGTELREQLYKINERGFKNEV